MSSKQTVKRGADVRRALADTAVRLGAIEEKLRIAPRLRAKGTRDMTEASRQAAADAGLDIRIEVALRGAVAPMSVLDLVRAVGAPAARVHAAIKRLRTTPCPTAADGSGAMVVHNHGTAEDPRWLWVIGDAVEAQTLYRFVEAMLRRRPYTFAEMQAATGARRGRISGATVEFARGDLPVWTVGGSDRRYVWFIGALSELPAEMRRHARAVRLAPDKNKI